jgi:hypothetical protein
MLRIAISQKSARRAKSAAQLKRDAEKRGSMRRGKSWKEVSIDLPHDAWLKAVYRLRCQIQRIMDNPAGMGSAWKEGQVKHFTGLLAELVANEPKV